MEQNKNSFQLSHLECNILRGIAILGIMLHNYCHWLAPIVKENEYQFNINNVNWFNDILSRTFTSSQHIVFHLLSFFGHYGVPIFLFLSAYGLVMKYEQKDTSEKALPVFTFISSHWQKLFRMMIVGFAAFILVDAITPGRHHYKVIDIIAQLGLINNFMPQPDKVIWPGPYWFFGLMFQLYIIYRLFLYKKGWQWYAVFIAICTLLQLLCSPNGEEINYLRYNFVGGMLPFGLGLLYAKYIKPIPTLFLPLTFVGSVLFIFLGSNFFFTWLFVPLFVCSASISLIKYTMLTQWNKLFPIHVMMKLFNKIGIISAAIFISHPITRKIIIPISKAGDYWAGLLLYLITSLCVAWLFHIIIQQLSPNKSK